MSFRRNRTKDKTFKIQSTREDFIKKSMFFGTETGVCISEMIDKIIRMDMLTNLNNDYQFEMKEKDEYKYYLRVIKYKNNYTVSICKNKNNQDFGEYYQVCIINKNDITTYKNNLVSNITKDFINDITTPQYSFILNEMKTYHKMYELIVLYIDNCDCNNNKDKNYIEIRENILCQKYNDYINLENSHIKYKIIRTDSSILVTIIDTQSRKQYCIHCMDNISDMNYIDDILNYFEKINVNIYTNDGKIKDKSKMFIRKESDLEYNRNKQHIIDTIRKLLGISNLNSSIGNNQKQILIRSSLSLMPQRQTSLKRTSFELHNIMQPIPIHPEQQYLQTPYTLQLMSIVPPIQSDTHKNASTTNSRKKKENNFVNQMTQQIGSYYNQISNYTKSPNTDKVMNTFEILQIINADLITYMSNNPQNKQFIDNTNLSKQEIEKINLSDLYDQLCMYYYYKIKHNQSLLSYNPSTKQK